MLKNADCTIYEKDRNYTPHIISGVYWFDTRGMAVVRSGLQVTDSVLVYLYETDYIPKAGDIIVKGACEFVFNAESEKSVSESVREFRTLHPDYAVVKYVSDARYGGLPHVEVIAR